MNSKWFIGVVVIALAFLGISLEQTAIPNQEIVVQFHLDAVSTNDFENAITIVTEQLQSIGVEGVQVTKLLDGNLKITYYSTIDVARVKDLFSKQENLLAGYSSFATNETTPYEPFDSDIVTYELNVSEIQTATDAAMGLHGSLVEFKSGNEWYVNPVVYLPSSNIDFAAHNTRENVARTQYEKVTLGIDTSSYKIPEVRAGPLS